VHACDRRTDGHLSHRYSPRWHSMQREKIQQKIPAKNFNVRRGLFFNAATCISNRLTNVDRSVGPSAPISRSFRPKLMIQEKCLPVTHFRAHLNWCGQSEDSSCSANALDDAGQWILTKPATIAEDLPSESFGPCSGHGPY